MLDPDPERPQRRQRRKRVGYHQDSVWRVRRLGERLEGQHEGRLLGLTQFLAEVLLKDNKDAIAVYNVSTGVRLWNERMTLQVIGANIFDEEVQQHVFGDIISRKITGQIGINF